jgi:hydroxyethylthiazole kinase-like uncharacterized protein yjeF
MATESVTAAGTVSGPLGLLVSARQMRAAEQSLFARGVDSFALMSAAGQAVADLVQRDWPEAPVTVLCGPGNNGGDGFIVAEALRRGGRHVVVLAMRSLDAYEGDAAMAATAWGGPVLLLDEPNIAAEIIAGRVVVDALYGIGLDRALSGIAVHAIEQCRLSGAAVVSVDIASGVSADTGQVLGDAMMATDTVTFGWPKLGHVLLPGRQYSGRLWVAPLDFDKDSGLAALAAAGDADIRANQLESWLLHLPKLGLMDHKYSRGHAVVFASDVMPGAGRLAARAARRIGAGMLTVAAPAEVLPLFMADQPGLVTRTATRAEDVVEILLDSRITAVLIGSGMPPDEVTREAVLNAVASARPVVIDGGGITAFADRPQDLFAVGRGDVVLTPHEGEFGRLFPDLGAALGKAERARLAAERSRCTVVLKGADTVIAEPPGTDRGGRSLINREASPYLATAGSGDVLAGLVLGLLAQGMPAFEAAAAAVWFHSEAGFAAGPGLIAEDLPERIPEVRKLLRW